MTIYSQHAQRGKVQILASYRSPDGVVSSTVTSVESATTATPIVDALNRISACATVPVSVYDMRDRGFDHYPTGHLAALTDRGARASLLDGAHSLWYEQSMWLLHEALTDLDDATASVPTPIRTALQAELETEARWLRDALAEYSEGIDIPDEETRRIWEFDEPFVAFEGGLEGLSSRDRKTLDHVEAGATGKELQDAVDDLRLLLDAHAQCKAGELQLQLNDLSIAAEPETMDRFYLSVEAPLPSGDYNRVQWAVVIERWEVDQWEVDDDGERYPGESHGEPMIRCVRAKRPTVPEVVELLDLCVSQEQLATWARTAIGEALTGTEFVVTEHCDN